MIKEEQHFIKPSDTTSLLEWDHPGSLFNNPVLAETAVDPFCCSSYWQFAFHEAFSPARRLLIRQSENSLLALASNLTSQGRLVTPMDNSWFFSTPLLGPDAGDLLEEVLPMLMHAERLMDSTRIFLGPFNEPFSASLKHRFGQHYGINRVGQIRQCRASLQNGFDGYMSRRSSSHRRSLKKQANRLQRLGVSFERATPAPVNHEVVYERMLDVERRSWKGIGHCGMTEYRPRQYYLAMIRRLAESGSARVIFARHGERDIGYIFGGILGNVYRGQQFSFDEEWRKHSVGNVLQAEQIFWLCEEGFQHYDMGPADGPNMDYKRHWAEEIRHGDILLLEMR